MDFSASHVIRRGPNAGMPRPMNDIMLDRLTSVMSAVVALKRNGYSVEMIDLNHAEPSIYIQNCSACQRLISSGEAADFGSGVENGVRFRKWAMKIHGVRVVWTERGH